MRRIPYLLPVLAVVFVSLLSVSCGKKDSDVVATLGDKEITLGDFLLAHNAISVFSRPPLLTFEDRERFLNTIIHKELLLDEAKKRGLDQDPRVLKATERWEMEYCIRALNKQVSEEGLEISLDDVKNYWIDSRSKYHVHDILVATAEAAQEIRGKLEDGGDFAQLAREYSTDEESAKHGGDLGFLDKNSNNPQLLQMARSVEVGEVSRVLRSGDGFHIIKVTEIQAPDMDGFEQERHLAASELRTQERNARWQQYLQEQLAAHQVEFDQETVSWLNGKLPDRGSADYGWQENVTDEEKSRMLVQWDGGSWTVADFMERFSPESGRGSLATSPGGGFIVRVLEGDILNMVNLDEAKKRGLDKLDDVARDIEKKKQSEMLEILHADLIGDVEVSDEKVRERYEEMKDDLVMPETVDFCMIKISDKEKIDRASARARRGEDFEKLAREYNQGQMKKTGGVYGPVPRDVVRIPEVQAALFDELEVGGVSDIIAPPARGYIMVKLLKKTPEHPMTFEEAKPQIKNMLHEEGENEALNAWLEKKRDELNVKVYPEVLNKLSEGEEEDVS